MGALGISGALIIVGLGLGGCGAPADDDEVAASSGGLTDSETCVAGLFCIDLKASGHEADLAMRNFAHSGVSLKLDFTFDNMTATIPMPYQGSFFGERSETLFSFGQDNADQGYSYSYTYEWRVGVMDVTHDDANVYQMPFAPGSSFSLTQGYNGSFSHQGELAFSLDFAMDEGTPVHAARDGIVMRTIDEFTEAGTTEDFKDKANLVSVLHSDGSIAEYVHLQEGGVAVSLGDLVKAGDLLGYSGNTGYSQGPHLHFHVLKKPDFASFETLSLKFKTGTDTVEVLQEGNTYTSQAL